MRRELMPVQEYIEDAVSFIPRGPRAAAQRSIRVARTLMPCLTAASILNGLKVPGEPDSSYRYVNVHNPECPLRFDTVRGEWGCAEAFERFPVWGLNWAGACLVCQFLGARLPTVQEWECFASNNDPERIFPWGMAPPNTELANFGEHFGGVSAVRRFPPSDLGFYDLAGNLCEWCLDRFEIAPGLTSSFERVVKGGAWSKDAHFLQISVNRGKWERLGTTTIGLRPVWDD